MKTNINKIKFLLNGKIFLMLMFLLLVIVLLSAIISSCSKNKENEITTLNDDQFYQLPLYSANSEGTDYLEIYEGLHITGTPIDVDIKSYRLNIRGAVDKELSLTFDDIKKMKSVREKIELTCPGYFIDYGYWTGVRVIELLNLSEIKKNATNVEFISIDGSYIQTLPIEKIKGDGFLIAYQFNDKEFSNYHGYPLRLTAKGEAGSYWVKWLGEINVVTD